MRYIAAAMLMLLLVGVPAHAGDYIKLASYADGDFGYINQTVSWDFVIERTCPDPPMIMGISHGFTMQATGSVTWDYDHPAGYWVDPDVNGWFNLGGLLFTDALSGDDMASGWFLTGGAAMPPSGGMPIISEHPFFSLTLKYGNNSGGQICIDSSFVGSAGAWKFSGLTCGLGGAPDRPLFLDAAGNDVHPICISIDEIGMPPTILNCPDVPVTDNHCNTLVYQFDVDPGMDGLNPATIVGWWMESGVGSIDESTGEYAVGPLPTGTYDACISVMNSCGQIDECCFQVTFTNNAPVVTNCPTQNLIVCRGNAVGFTFTASDPDPCDGLTFTLIVDPTGAAPMTTDGEFSWQTSFADAGLYIFLAEVGDGEGGTAYFEFAVEVLGCVQFIVYIDKLEDVYQGCYAYPGIWLERGTDYFGGFDFLVEYDVSAMTFMSAKLGSFLNGCWEYFTYRYNWNGNCGGSCPSGILRAVGMADINNGAYHPDPACMRHPGGVDPVQLVEMTFYVSNDYTLECMYAPIRFLWMDCGDNAMSNVGGDSLWISRYVYDFEGRDMTGEMHYGGHWWIGDCQNPDPTKPSAIPYVDYRHGGLDIVCTDSIDARGDINLNNIENEIADAVLFTNYFIYGLVVFDINLHGQIAATDVNNDGRVLTVGDLVYLVRIITGDALPFPKLSPFSNTVDIIEGDKIIAKSSVDIGAAVFVFANETEVELLADGMKMRADCVDGQTRVLVWSDNKNRIAAGNTEILAASGTLVEASVSDYYGNEMNVNLRAGHKPTSFALMQNYPNPFNPSTDITIKLPTSSQYRIDIYNVAGQLVKSFSGYGVGDITVTWNAFDAASGIYFYKATAGDFAATKKMVLMK